MGELEKRMPRTSLYVPVNVQSPHAMKTKHKATLHCLITMPNLEQLRCVAACAKGGKVASSDVIMLYFLKTKHPGLEANVTKCEHW